jgi:hypothetical protein
MTVTLGILALLEAKAGKGDELAAFLKAGRELAVAEEGTVTWSAFKISDASYVERGQRMPSQSTRSSAAGSSTSWMSSASRPVVRVLES